MNRDGCPTRMIGLIRAVMLMLAVLMLAACQATSSGVSRFTADSNNEPWPSEACLTLLPPVVEIQWHYPGGSLRREDLRDRFVQSLLAQQRTLLSDRTTRPIRSGSALSEESSVTLLRRLGQSLDRSASRQRLDDLVDRASLMEIGGDCPYAGLLILDASLVDNQLSSSTQSMLWAVWSTGNGQLLSLAVTSQSSQSHQTLVERIANDLDALMVELP